MGELEVALALGDGAETHHVEDVVIGEGAEAQLVPQDLETQKGPGDIVPRQVEGQGTRPLLSGGRLGGRGLIVGDGEVDPVGLSDDVEGLLVIVEPGQALLPALGPVGGGILGVLGSLGEELLEEVAARRGEVVELEDAEVREGLARLGPLVVLAADDGLILQDREDV